MGKDMEQLGNNFKNVRNWRSICQKNNTPNEISAGFNTLDMFSMYVWHVHNVETLLKLFSDILDRQLRTFFEIIAHLYLYSVKFMNLNSICIRIRSQKHYSLTSDEVVNKLCKAIKFAASWNLPIPPLALTVIITISFSY